MFYIYLFLYSCISDTKIIFLLILQSVYLTGKFLEIIGLNDTHAHVHRTPFNRTYVSQLVSHLYGEKVYGFTARCSWHCGGHCATIVGRVQRWWVADNRKSSDGNGRKETKKGGRKVREIGTSSRIETKIGTWMHAHGNVPFNGLFFNHYEMEARVWPFSSFFVVLLTVSYHFYSRFPFL